MSYDHQAVEKKWQDFWQENQTFKASDDSDKPKYYALDMFPYPSGAGLHVGHPLGYTATDIISRKRRHEGFEVLHPMGWDSFGLPAENYAIKTKVHPEESTLGNIQTFKRQLQSLGFSFDWDREVASCLPDYYRWTQWFFRFLYEKDLAYRKKAPVNWCEDCHTVLANEQVVDGACERCKTEVIQKNLTQWFFRVTDFIEDQEGVSGLLSGLDKIDWPNSTKINQRNWIGRSEGAEVDFQVKDSDQILTVYTTRIDTLFSGTFLVLAPEHECVSGLTTEGKKAEVEAYVKKAKAKTEIQRTEEKDKEGVFLGSYAINPATGEEMQIWVSDFVLVQYGTGIVFADAHDERDFELAKKYDIPLKISLLPTAKEDQEKVLNFEICFHEEGVLCHSDQFDGLTSAEARPKIIEWLAAKGAARSKINYKLRDWLVSRQRYWGAPIPVVYDDQGDEYLLPDDELPVSLPKDVDFVPTGESPLTQSESFHHPEDLQRIEDKLKASGALASERKIVRRESDTMDTFVCSSWYMWRFMDPKNTENFCDKNLANHWGPIDLSVGGAEHTVLHLLYSRFFCKALKKYGFIDYDEPFAALRHQGMILAEDGRKMSKSLGNVVNPDEVVNEFGADTLRCYEMFMGPFHQQKPWSTSSVGGIRKWLDRVVRVFEKPQADTDTPHPVLHKTIKQVTEQIDQMKFNTAISQMMILTNALLGQERISKDVLEKFALILSPFAPHLAEEFWARLGHTDTIAYEKWPDYDPALLVEDSVVYAVQVNGKLRGDIEMPKDADKDTVIAEAKKIEKVQKYLAEGEIKKEIFVPGKIVGFVVK